MKVMIMASGRGSRLRPLTDHIPKPLLPMAGFPLLHWHLSKLAGAGFREIVINTGWLGDQIEDFCGSGEAWGLHITYVRESRRAGEQLEVGGGIVSALPILGADPFLVLNADIWTEWPYEAALTYQNQAHLATLFLVNDAFQPDRPGDFSYDHGRLQPTSPLTTSYLFAGMSILSPRLFAHCVHQRAYFLFDILSPHIFTPAVLAVYYPGFWVDMGTPAAFDFLSRIWGKS